MAASAVPAKAHRWRWWDKRVCWRWRRIDWRWCERRQWREDAIGLDSVLELGVEALHLLELCAQRRVLEALAGQSRDDLRVERARALAEAQQLRVGRQLRCHVRAYAADEGADLATEVVGRLAATLAGPAAAAGSRGASLGGSSLGSAEQKRRHPPARPAAPAAAGCVALRLAVTCCHVTGEDSRPSLDQVLYPGAHLRACCRTTRPRSKSRAEKAWM